MLIDTHLHLDAQEFAPNRAQLWADAQAAGVASAIVPAVSAANFDAVLTMRQQFGVGIAFGLHPIYLAEHEPDHLALLEHYLATHRPVAVGECGLDGFVPGLDLATQEQWLLAQLKLARRYDLPVILHVRRAQDRVLKCLRQVRVRGGIAHAFNGSEQQAKAFADLGFALGFGGAMTYAGSQRIRRLAATLPMSWLVLETDGPDIPPAWAPDQPNIPANLGRFAEEMARLRGMPVQELAALSTCNVKRIFGEF